MIELGSLEGNVLTRKAVEIGVDLAVWQELPEMGSLTFRLELYKAIPVPAEE